jgi:FkbM family methyltransferase
MIIRQVLERLTRHLVFRRRLPAAFGNAALYVSPAAGLRFLFRSLSHIDPPLLLAADKLVKTGDVIWDIGANIGLFSLAAAVRAGDRGEVIAFEPDTWLVQLLRRTSSAQPPGYAIIKVVPAAVASEISLRQFSIATRSRASNALAEYGSSQMGGVREQQIVATFNLDWLVKKLPRPNIIKIDVEGAEIEVLRDQSYMLNEVRPVILCEVGSQCADQITRILTSASYRLLDGERALKEENVITRATWSTVAIPEEKMNRLRSNTRNRPDDASRRSTCVDSQDA